MQKPLEIKNNFRCVHMLDEVNAIIMSNLTRSSIKGEGGNSNRFESDKTV